MSLVTFSVVSTSDIMVPFETLTLITDALELMFVGIGFICLPLCVYLYTRINASRDRLQREMEERGEKLTPEEIRELGDRAPDFRYTL